MTFPSWLKPGLLGAAAGAIILAIAGFSWGGWVTGGSASTMASKASLVAVTQALTPYCVQNAAADPATVTLMADLMAASTYNRKDIVSKAGWATPLGADKPNSDLAQACQLVLAAAK